jgi:hypothetical protein
MRRLAKLEVHVDDRSLQVWRDFQTVFRVWFDPVDHHLVVSCPKFDEIEWVNHLTQPPAASPQIEVDSVVRQKDAFSMSLPRLSSKRLQDGDTFAPTPEPKSSSGGSHTGTGMGHHTRDVILNSILDSMLANPNASKRTTEQESARIAKECGVSIGSVAAVRANYTRGRYGEPDSVLRLRATFLQKNAPLKEQAQRG